MFAFLSSNAVWYGFSAASGMAAAFWLKNDERGWWRTAFVTVPVSFAGFHAARTLWNAFPVFSREVRATSSVLFSGLDALFAIRDLSEAGQASSSVFAAAAAEASGPLSMRYYAEKMAGSAIPDPDPAVLRQEVMEALAEMEERMKTASGPQRDGLAAAMDFSISRARARSFPEEFFATDPEIAEFSSVGRTRRQVGISRTVQEDLDRLAGRPDRLSEYLRQLRSSLRQLLTGAVRPDPVFSYTEDMAFIRAGGSGVAMHDFNRVLRTEFSFSEADIAGLSEKFPGLRGPLQVAAQQRAFEKAYLVSSVEGQPLGLEFYRGGRRLQVPLIDPSSGMVRTGPEFRLAGAARLVLHGEQMTPLDAYVLERLSEDWDALEKTIQKAVIWRASHVDDEFMQALTGVSDTAASVYSEITPETAWFRRLQAVPTELPEFNGRRIDELGLAEREQLIRRLGGRIRKYGSESSFRKMVFETPEIEKIRLGQLSSMKKQDPVFRSFSKPYRLRADSVLEPFQPRVLASQLAEVFPEGVPAARLRFAGVSPQLVAFFSDLPAHVAGLANPKIRQKLIRHLSEDIRVDLPDLPEDEVRRRAEAALAQLETFWRQNPVRMNEARALGTLGETEFLAAPRVSRLQAGERLSYKLRAVNQKVMQEDPRVEFTAGELLGYDLEGRPVTLEASSARMVSIANLPEERMIRLTLETVDPLQGGSKMDVLGRKGLMTFGNDPSGHAMRVRALNIIHEATGRGRPYARSADVFVNQAYFSTDLGEEAFQAVLEAAQTAAESAPDLTVTRVWLDDLAREGFRVERFGSGRLRLLEDSEVVAALDDAGRARRIERILQRTRHFLSQLEHHAGSIPADWARAWTSMRQGDRQISLEEFFRLYYQPGTAAVWDSTRREMPRQVRLTYDVLSELHRAGEFEAVRDLLSQARPLHGDASETFRFLETLTGPEWKPAEGASVIPLDRIGPLPKSRQPGSLAGTIFDPDFAATQKNYWIDLGFETEFEAAGRRIRTRYLPVLGTQAYLGGSNPFGTGQHALGEYQSVLTRVIEMIQQGGEETAAAALGQYFREVLPMMAGKEGLWRQPLLASRSVVGAIQSRPSRSWVELGGERIRNPFEVVIGRDLLRELPEDVARRLTEQGHAYAVAFRHPVSATPFVRVRLARPDDFVGPRIVGIDEGLRSLLQADSDRDFLNLVFLRSKEAIDRARNAVELPLLPAETAGAAAVAGSEAARAASEAIPLAERMRSQWKQVRAAQLLQGTAEDVTRMTAAYSRAQRQAGFYDDLMKVVSAARATPGGLAPERLQSLVHRLAGDTIGAYSNVLSTLYLSLEHHPAIPVAGVDQTILHALLWNIRQVPISAAKGKMGLGEQPMRLYWQMLSGLRAADPEAGARIFTDAVIQISEGTKFESVIGSQRDLDDIAAIFGIREIGEGSARRRLKVGDRINLFAEVARSERGRRLLRDFVVHRNRDVDAMATLLTRGEMSAEEVLRHLDRIRSRAPSAATYLRAGLAGEKSAASASAAALGAANRTLAQAAQEAGQRFRRALPVVAAALGVAGLAGVLGTPLRPAGKDFRPAVADVAPGEEHRGMEGSRRPVVVRQKPSGPERIMAAPDAADSVMEIETEAKSRTDWEEFRRIFSGSGDQRRSSVEIRRLSGPGDAGRLRREAKLRDELNRQIRF